MRRTENRSSLFLLELIINLFLFAVCAAVCVGILLYARGLSMESRDLTDAVYLAQSVVETWPSAEAKGDPGISVKSSELTVKTKEEGGALSVYVYKHDKLIYSLEGVTRDG